MRTLFWLLSLAGTVHSADLHIEANWAIDRQFSAPHAAQLWIEEYDWQPSLNTEMSLQQSGFEIAAQITDDKTELTQLYQDISGPQAEWTVGLKSQEWAYAHSSDQLNWLDHATVIVREQYFSALTLQTFCQFDTVNTPGCGLRTSGWLGSLDWQLMTRRVQDWQFAMALQAQLGLGGLVYLEGHYDNTTQWITLTSPSASGTYAAVDAQGSQLSGTAGLQWTWPAELTLNVETNLREHHLHEENWKQIAAQLDTSSAGLVAPFIDEALPAHQYLVRLNWTIDTYELEQVMVMWPAANTWLSRTRIMKELTPELTFETAVDVPAPEGIFASVGAGPSVKLQLSYRDGIKLGR